MNRTAAPAALALLALALGGLTACAAPTAAPGAETLEATRGERIAAAYEEVKANAEAEAASEPAPAPVKPEPGVPEKVGYLYGACQSVAWVSIWSENVDESWTVDMIGQPVDTGSAPHASGNVEVNEAGVPIAYTVAEGDMLDNIAGRVCLELHSIGQLNGVSPSDPIYPGQRVLFAEDPANPWQPRER